MYQFSKYLPDYDWLPVIVTAPLPKDILLDNSLPDLPGVRIERLYYPAWWPQPHLTYVTSPAPIENTQRRLRLSALIPLERDILVTIPAITRIIRLARAEGVSLIYASGGPPSVLLHGWLVARALALPLYLELRDPWSINYLQADKPRWIQRIEQAIERFLLHRAHRILFTSATTCQDYQALYPEIDRSVMSYFYTGYDPMELEAPPAEGPFTLLHFGNCFGVRSLETVLYGLHLLRGSAQWPSEGVKLLNFGRVHARDVQLAEQLGLGEVLECVQPEGYKEGMARLAAADLLILLGYGDEQGFIPAKTFDYLLAKRPILCLTRCPELTRIIHTTGSGGVVTPQDIDGARDIIAAACKKGRAPRPDSPYHSEAEDPFDVRSSVRDLAALLNETMRQTQS